MKNRQLHVAITGANGFVARNLRKILYHEKIYTICIARRNFPNYKNETTIISKEILPNFSSKLKNCETLVHLVGTGRETPENTYYDVNVKMTKKIIELCKKAKIKKIIFNSGLGVSENSTSSYFISKLNAEKLIINSGLDYTIFRPSYIIGKDDYLTRNLKKQIRKGKVLIPGSGDYKIQPILVDDAARIIFKAIISKKFSKTIFDLVGSRTISYNNFVKDFVGSKAKIKKIDLEKAYFEALHNPKNIFSVDDLNIMIGSFTGNSRNLEKVSGLKLKPFSKILDSSSLS